MRAFRSDDRREFAAGHRLQCAHFDEKLAFYVTTEKAI